MYSGVYISSNNGDVWTKIEPFYGYLWKLAVTSDKVFMSTGTGIYSSTNHGINWSLTGLESKFVRTICTNGNFVFAGVPDEGVYLSSNNGIHWYQTLLNNQDIYALYSYGTNVLAGTYSSGVFISTDMGATWNQTALNNHWVLSFAVNGNYIFAGTRGGGVFVSSNNGVSWDNTAIAGGRVYALLNEGGKIIAGTFESGIFVTSNNGVSWTAKNEGFGSVISVYSLLIKDNILYAGTSLSVWKRPVSEIIKVRSISSEIPQKFALNQNYPNPFNSTTRIEFKVSKNEFINIKVFDINGKVIETLVNEKLNPGTYSVNFKGYNISSGIYFYKMTANNFLETKKFILIK